MAVVELLQEHYCVPILCKDQIDKKKAKIKEYKIYSQNEGLLE